MSRRGQTAIVLILMIAIALVIYSASLNWGRISQFKALTTIGSNTAASGMASMMASYGESQLQVQLGGRREICKKTNFLVLLVTFIIAVVVTVYCWGTCIAGTVAMVAAVVGVVLAAAALVINVTVVEPGLTRLWNKLQSNLSSDGQIIESALMGGMRATISDNETMDDHFDMDVDGLWVDDEGEGNNIEGSGVFHRDKFSRFGYYYTRRLLSYNPRVVPEITEFVDGLKELMFDNPFGKVGPPPNPPGCTPAEQTAGDIRCQNPDNFGIYDPGCATTIPGSVPNPYCDPCCQPEFQPDGETPLRPVDCTVAQVAACGSGDYPVATYAYQYDPFLENYTNAFYSFREMLGIDDENTGFNRSATNPNSPPPQSAAVAPNNVFRKEDTTGYYTAAVQVLLGISGGIPDNRRGIFPFLWEMSTLAPVEARGVIIPPPVVPFIPKSDSVIMMTANPATCTIALCPNTFVALENQCAATVGTDAGTGRALTDGFYWKSGSDEYCSSVFPYNDCIDRVGNCSDGVFGGAIPNCGCPASDDPTLWRDDNIDNLVYGLRLMIIWAQHLFNMNVDNLIRDIDAWYPEAATWIAPRCTGPVNNWCYNGPNDGQLLIWRDMFGSWMDLIDTWLYRTSFSDDVNWCLPTAATANASFLPIELSVIPSLNPATPIPVDRDGASIPLIWGDINDTIACFNYNSNNVARLTSCQANCTASPLDYTGNANVCLNLPRSVVNLPNSSAIAVENAAYATAQRMQNCLSSTCADSFGVPLAVCTGLVAQPVDCVAFAPGNLFYDAVRAERDNQFNLSNFCEPSGGPTTGFQRNLVIAIDAANVQAPDFDPTNINSRLNKLTATRDGAVNAKNVFLDVYNNLNAFLAPCTPGGVLGEGCDDCSAGGPVANLICARQAPPDGLANFVIYGWQSKPVSGRGPEGTDPERGYWHIVRAEAFAPKRCYNYCGTNTLPWVRTRTFSRGLNRIRCYTLVETDGRVIARVTRYDEDHDSPGARLANGQLLWKVKFTNPGVPSTVTPGNLDVDCRHPAEYDEGLSPESIVKLNGAFMINQNPVDNSVDDPPISQVCFDKVISLLTRGVQSTTCARYYYDGAINHMNLKFTPCNQADVSGATACAMLGGC